MPDLHLDDALMVLKQRTPEGEAVDYKVALSKPRDLAKDAAAFANTRGGWLFFGVNEANRLPTTTPGIEFSVNNQDVQDWIQNVIQTHTTPVVKWQSFILSSQDLPELASDRIVLAIYVPRSSLLPQLDIQTRYYYIRRDGESLPASEEEVRGMYYESHSAPKLIIVPGYLPSLNWRPTIQIHNVGSAPALEVTGRLAFGPELAENVDLFATPLRIGNAQLKELHIPLIRRGDYDQIVAVDFAPDPRHTFWTIGKVMWVGSCSDQSGVAYSFRQVLDVHHWEEDIVNSHGSWPRLLDGLDSPQSRAEFGLWSANVKQKLDNYLRDANDQTDNTAL